MSALWMQTTAQANLCSSPPDRSSTLRSRRCSRSDQSQHSITFENQVRWSPAHRYTDISGNIYIYTHTHGHANIHQWVKLFHKEQKLRYWRTYLAAHKRAPLTWCHLSCSKWSLLTPTGRAQNYNRVPCSLCLYEILSQCGCSPLPWQFWGSGRRIVALRWPWGRPPGSWWNSSAARSLGNKPGSPASPGEPANPTHTQSTKIF